MPPRLFPFPANSARSSTRWHPRCSARAARASAPRRRCQSKLEFSPRRSVKTTRAALMRTLSRRPSQPRPDPDLIRPSVPPEFVVFDGRRRPGYRAVLIALQRYHSTHDSPGFGTALLFHDPGISTARSAGAHGLDENRTSLLSRPLQARQPPSPTTRHRSEIFGRAGDRITNFVTGLGTAAVRHDATS